MNEYVVVFVFYFSCVFVGDNCEVKDSRYGYLFDLKFFVFNDIIVSVGEYIYYFRVCGRLFLDVCLIGDRFKVILSC